MVAQLAAEGWVREHLWLTFRAPQIAAFGVPSSRRPGSLGSLQLCCILLCSSLQKVRPNLSAPQGLATGEDAFSVYGGNYSQSLSYTITFTDLSSSSRVHTTATTFVSATELRANNMFWPFRAASTSVSLLQGSTVLTQTGPGPYFFQFLGEILA
eukprot:3557651-Rhodomonas_salina.2